MTKEKAFALFFLVTVLGVLVSRPTVETDATGLAGSGQSTFDPTATTMLKHLEQSHGVRIGSASDCDVVVSMVGEKVQVVLRDEFLGRLREDAIPALELAGSTTLLSETSYNAFLFMFHAYLTMAPPKSG